MGLLVFSFLIPEALKADHFVDPLGREGSTDVTGFNFLLLTPMSGGDHGAIIKRDLLPEERRAGAIPNGVVDNADNADEQKLSEDEPAEYLFGILSLAPPPPQSAHFQLRDSIQTPQLLPRSGISSNAGRSGGYKLYGTRLSTVLLGKGTAVRGDPREARIFRCKVNIQKEREDDPKGKNLD
ncbi:hypothetical protein ACEPAH_8602 [Sanghuangporus vaninii]